MDLDMKGKIIIVSGGARGIGEGITWALAREDALPIIVGRDRSDNHNYLLTYLFQLT